MLERFGHGGDLVSAAETYGAAAGPFLDFSSNMNPLGPPQKVKAVLASFWQDIVRYPDPAVRELRGRLAERFGIPAESILCGNGAAELIELAAAVLQAPAVGLLEPSFSEYAGASRKAGSRILRIPLQADDDYAPTWPLIAPVVSHTDALFLGYPNNPTGRLPDPGIIRKMLAKNTRVILDEAFLDFHPDEEALTFVREAALSRSLIVIRSMTKFYAIPGIRLGFAVAHPEVIEAMRRRQVPWSVNGLAQQIGVAVLSESDYAERTRRIIAEERARLTGRLNGLGLRVTESDTNFLLVSLPAGSGMDAAALQSLLGHKGILIRDGGHFPGLDRYKFRIAVRLRDENERLIEALQSCLDRKTDGERGTPIWR